MIEYGVDVDRPPRHRSLVTEYFHAIDQGHDPVRFIADQSRQRAIFGRCRLFEQLRGSTDTRQRVLDLVREHRGQRDHRTRSTSMGKLPIHLVGDGAFLKHHNDVPRMLAQRRDMQIDLTVAADARRSEIDLVFVHR